MRLGRDVDEKLEFAMMKLHGRLIPEESAPDGNTLVP